MKTQLKRFSKSTISVLLAVCLLFSCMTVGIIATDAAKTAEERVGAVDDSESLGSNTSDGTAILFFKMNAVNWWIADSGNQNFAYFFNNTTNKSAWSAHSVNQTGNYYYVVVPSGTWEGVILTRNNTTTSPSWDNKWNQTGDLSWTAGKNYISAFSENSATATFSTYQVDSTASLAASSTNITTAQTATLTPSLSSNTTYNEIKSTSYTVTKDSGSGTGSVSDGVFSATGAGTYTVTATVTYNAKGFTGITKTATATKQITVTAATTPSIDSFTIGGSTSKTLNIGETATLASTTSNTSNSVTYSTTSDAISITGTTVKALKPVTSATITATLVDGSTYTKTVTVKVNTPSFTLSYSPTSIPANGSATATPTVTVANANSSSSKSSLAYSITNGTSYASINASTGVVTSKSSAGSVTAKVTGTVTYNGVSYTSAQGTATVTVSALPDVYIDCYPQDQSTSIGGQAAYDSTASTTIGSGHLVFKKSISLTSGTNYYIRSWDGSKNYKPSSEITTDKPLSGTGVSGTESSESTKITPWATGSYDIYYDNDSHKFYVQGPHTVTFNANGHGTAPTAQVVAYGGKATQPTAPTASGWTFGGWYKEEACTNAWNFTTDTVTTDKTLYAKWTSLPALTAPAITYNSSSATTQSMNAAEGQKARISWSAVSNAGTYEVYKGTSKVATVTTTYYDIERGNSYGGKYTVKAVPSDTSSYLTSAASNDITFTFSKVSLNAPTVAQNVTEVVKGGTATFTITNTNTSYALGTDFKYQHTGRNNTTYADMSTGGLTWTTGQSNTVGTDTYKFKAVALKSDYFTSSGETTKTVNVVAPTTTLYVSKDIAFTHAYIYQDGSHIHVAWPGQATNTSPWVDAAPLNYYKLEFQEDWTSFRVIMNDGRNDNPDKTGDMTTGEDIGGTYYIDTAVSNQAVTLNEGAPLPSLSAPTNVQLGGSSSNQTVDAVKNGKINLTWSAVSGAGTYDVYKDGTKVTSSPITTTTYAIEKGSSYSGTYTVVANPDDSTTHTASKPSTGIKLTVNKVALARPTITLNKSTVNNTDTGVTVTVTNYNALMDACTFTLSGATAAGGSTSISSAGVFTITDYNSSAYDGANNNITVTAEITSGNTDYYSIATATSAASVLKVYKPDFALCGDVNKVTATGITTPSDANWNTKSVFVIESTTQTPGVYSLVFTTTAEAYLGLRNTSDRYSVKVDGVSYNTYELSYTIPNEGKSGMELIKATNGSMKFAANKTYTITVNQTNNTVSVSTDSWNVTTTARYKDYDLATGTYKAVATGTTGGTVSPATASVKKGQSTTITASAASGYTFTGWFTAEACTGTPVSTAASYTVTPSADITYYALFTKNEPSKVTISVASVSGATINATWNGTTKTNGQSLTNVPVGAEVSVTITTADNKYLDSTTPALTNGKFTVTASTTSITATLGDKLKVTCTTNNTSLGTVSANTQYAKPGDTVTLTYTAAAGTLKTLTVVNTSASPATKIKEWTRDANGDMKVTYPSQSSANQFTQVGLSGIAGSIYSFIKDAGEALGAADDSTAVGDDDALTFTMPNGAVTVTSTYEEYVGTSEYIYHGVNTSGQAVSGYESKAMSEGVIGGQKYAYYNVTGRESVGYDQLFYISKGGSTEGRYVYFTDKGGTYADWANHDPTAYFYNSSGAVGDAWPGKAMTWVSGEGSNVDKNWKLEIPAGATGVIFTNGKSGGDFKQTHDINLTNTNGSYYPSGYSSNKYEVTQWTTPGENSGIVAGTDYYWDTDVYKDQWYTGGFNNHNVSNVNNFAKPKDGNGQTFSTNQSDYYIVVLYPNTSYTFNLPGHDAETKTVGSKPMVLWMPQLPGQQETAASTVKVYAKDGAIRRVDDQPKRNNTTYSYFEQHANTFVYSDSGYATHIGTRSSNDNQSSEGSTGYNGYTYDYIAKFEKGKTLYIKTTIDSTLAETHYLAAYSINGKSYQLHTASEGTTVTEAFTVPEDWEDNYVEITPIYFPKNAECITFYIEGYDEEVMNAGWGNTPYVYPFYQDQNFNYVGGINNAFGGYPGQPMLFYKGNYYTKIPKSYSTIPESGGAQINCTIKGVTLGNGYWDDIHLLTKEVSSHFQTYDYDDLYKIYKEYPDQADHIICSFKYRTQYNNNEPQTCTNANTSTYTNGWEVLTDYYGRPVDVFGNLLKDDALATAESMIANDTAATTANVVHVISQDYKSNSAGDYATEWAIYNTGGTKVVATSGGKTTIVPSALAISDESHFQNYDAATRSFQSIYHALKADASVVGQPVVITYEKSIYGGGDKADRCDARWSFSTTGQPITAKTRIEYTDDGKTWNTDTYTSGTGTGSHTGTMAYFTGTAATATDTPSTPTGNTSTTTLAGATGNGYYTLNAKNAGQYEFVGWYLLRDNYQNINLRSDYGAVSEFPSHAEMAKNGDIFVARFKKTATGTLDIFHEVHPQTSGYGHVYVSAVVKDSGNTQVASYPASGQTDHITIPNAYIRSGEGYKVVATFTAVPYPTSHFDDFYATIGELLETYDGYNFIVDKQIDKNAGTATITYDVDKLFSVASGSPVQTVTSITHYSKFSLRTDLKYNLTYQFHTRYYGDKLYKYTNESFTAEELRSYFRSQIEDDEVTSIKIDKQFVQRKAPFESNYREDLTWDVDLVQCSGNTGSLTATQVPIQWANAMVYDFQDNGTMKTQQMAAPLDKLFDKTVETKPANADSARQNWDTTCTDDKLYTAIRTSYNNGSEDVPLYLHHWEAYRLDSFTYKTNSDGKPQMKEDGYNLDIDTGKSTLVCMSYSTKFNYIGYEDYAIVPVYTTDQMSTPERQAASDRRTDSSATLLTITRNHWNTTVSGTADSGKYGEANKNYDRLYVDFMLNYNYSKGGKNVLLSSTGDNIKVGFIVRSYTIDYSSGTGQKDYTGRSSKVYVLTDEEKQTIDNKNRIEYCYGFANTQNNSQYGLNFEFIPFIVDTASQGSSEGDTVNINGTDYKTLYASSTVSILDGVNFYMIGKSDTTWDK